ncbi:MAG TPA: hypothetical protein DDW46_07935 [Dehalococcoidia bacterium]|nr:hypothetical protein [Dehalococcoidia bacterium]|tara:strand:+ start:107 stop:385 length:279 start_codon:yes stop_codon:yes gene_type:complete
MEMKENVMTKIDFITAAGGGIRMYAGDGLKGWGGTAKGIAYTLRTVGLADCVMGSSSMDFASEEGFENDGDARELWDEAIGIYNWEVNGVAS